MPSMTIHAAPCDLDAARSLAASLRGLGHEAVFTTQPNSSPQLQPNRGSGPLSVALWSRAALRGDNRALLAATRDALREGTVVLAVLDDRLSLPEGLRHHPCVSVRAWRDEGDSGAVETLVSFATRPRGILGRPVPLAAGVAACVAGLTILTGGFSAPVQRAVETLQTVDLGAMAAGGAGLAIFAALLLRAMASRPQHKPAAQPEAKAAVAPEPSVRFPALSEELALR